jgi:hypothetical protein
MFAPIPLHCLYQQEMQNRRRKVRKLAKDFRYSTTSYHCIFTQGTKLPTPTTF